MSVLFTFMGRITDWQTLRALNREHLAAQAQIVGATRYQVYRSVNDAAQVLIIAELPDHDALREMVRRFSERLNAILARDLADHGVWEATEWESIEGRTPTGGERATIKQSLLS